MNCKELEWNARECNEHVLKMQGNATECKKLQRNAKKYTEVHRNAKKCTEM